MEGIAIQTRIALVVLKPGRITDVAKRFRIKVDKDVMREFVEERR